MAQAIFFPSYDAYEQWMMQIPGVFPAHEPEADDPKSEEFPDLEGPYYLTPAYLALRVVGSYCVLQRTESVKDADFTWYVCDPEKRDGGERVYAAYVWDTRTTPPARIEAQTLVQVRQQLRAFFTRAKDTPPHREVRF